MNGLLKPGLMRGLSAIFSTLLILALSLTSVANANSSVINRQLGTSKMSSGIFGEAFWGVIKLRFRKIQPKKS